MELPAPWVGRYLDRSGGWRLAPAPLVEQLAALRPPAPLVLIPRRQARKLNGGHAANVNALTDKDALDPVTGMVRYSGVPVTLRARG